MTTKAKPHVIKDRDVLEDVVTRFRATIASGPSRYGRKSLRMSRYLFYVEVDGREEWSGTDFDEAVCEYNRK